MKLIGFNLDEIGFKYEQISEDEAKLYADVTVVNKDHISIDVIKWNNIAQQWVSMLNKKEYKMSLDLTKILKGCEGMTFYHTLVGDYVTLCSIIPDSEHPIRYNYKDHYEGIEKGKVS